MGTTPSKEQIMAKAIEDQDFEEIEGLITELSGEQMRLMCKSLVPRDPNQCTILHYATWQGNPKLLALFLEYADDLEIHDGLGWTPLVTAVHRDSEENVQILLKQGAKIDCDSVQGMDLLATAMSFKNAELVQILIEHGAQVAIPANAQAKNRCHLLHFAVDDGLTDIARILIEKGNISVNTQNQSGWSPLHLAAGHHHLDIVKLLVEHGAEINIKDHDGNTPLAWAREVNAEEVINELESHGGIADEEWHGQKLELSNHRRQPEEEDSELQGIDNNQFEIEDTVENDSDIRDALQRQN